MILERERALKRLHPQQGEVRRRTRTRSLSRLTPRDPQLGKEEVKEEEITRLNEQVLPSPSWGCAGRVTWFQCQKSIDLLLAKFGDSPSYRYGAQRLVLDELQCWC